MESQISPKNIEERVEAMAVAEKEASAEVKAPEAEAKAPEVKAPEVKVEPKAPEAEVKAPEVKPEKRQPNDPNELRKWATKSAQEAAALREEMKAMRAAIDKMSKKPVDYAALSKDPEALKKHVEQERAEAAAEFQRKLTEANNRAMKNETLVAKAEFEKDTQNYPRWNKLFPLIQNLAANSDGRINFNGRPAADVLHDLYTLADELSPAEIAAVVAAPAPAAAVAPVAAVTEADIQARIDAAVAKAKADAEAGIRAEQNGAGIGSTGKGGRRDGKVSKEAYMKMPLKDLKSHIQQQS